MIEMIKKNIKTKIESIHGIEDLIVEEPKRGVADLAIPLFSLAKLWKMNPKMAGKWMR